jgi:hypothetical protein
MSEHITEWLGAYLDGELHGTRLRQVKNHLTGCLKCQAELDEMRELSALLREIAPSGDFLPTERFVANLTLNLPRQNETTQPRKAVEIGWWLVPAGVIATWIFIQMTVQLSSLVMAASDLGLFGDSLIWLSGSSIRQTAWFSLSLNFFGSQAEMLAFLNSIDLFLRDLAGQFLWQAILGIIYLAWLARWWLGQQKQTSTPGNFSRS